MALRKKRVINTDLNSLRQAEQPRTPVHTRADNLVPGHYIYTDMHKGVVFDTVLHNSGRQRVDYYDEDGNASIAVYRPADIIPVMPWPDRAKNKAIFAYQLRAGRVEPTTPPPAPVSSPTQAPSPYPTARADSINVGDTVTLGIYPRVVERIETFTMEDGFELLKFIARGGSSPDPQAFYRRKDATLQVIERAPTVSEPQEFHLGMALRINDVMGHVTAIEQVEHSSMLRITWYGDYPSTTIASFVANGKWTD